MYVLGIDGGGTKTTGVIVTYHGDVCSEATVGGSNLNSKDRSDVIFELVKLVNELKKKDSISFSKITAVFAGMSGGGNLTNQDDLKNILLSLVPQHVKVIVDNDAITALYSGTLGDPGIVQIAGTGAITYGINQAGERSRVGGWGHYFSDHGSGYAIGRDGLRASFMAYDGMEKETIISDLLLKHFQVSELPDLIKEIYQHPNPKEVIASLSKIVVEAADQGDDFASVIIEENAIYLAQAIVTLTRKLFPIESHTESIPVVLAGGLFNRYDLFNTSIENVLRHNQINAKLIIPKILPVGGAVIAALKHENIQINHDFLNRFKEVKKEK